MLIEHPACRVRLIPFLPFSVPARDAFHVAKDKARFINGAFPSATVIPKRFAIRPRTDLRYGFAAHILAFHFCCFGATVSVDSPSFFDSPTTQSMKRCPSQVFLVFYFQMSPDDVSLAKYLRAMFGVKFGASSEYLRNGSLFRYGLSSAPCQKPRKPSRHRRRSSEPPLLPTRNPHCDEKAGDYGFISRMPVGDWKNSNTLQIKRKLRGREF
jgi:hypothetical protein